MYVRESNPIIPSLFPDEDENGYPFFDQITCNLQAIFQLTHQLASSTELYMDNQNKQHDTLEKRECDFNIRLILCKGNLHCFLQLETMKPSDDHNNGANFTMTNNLLIIDEIYNTNCFHFDNNRECVEISLYHEIINGYFAYKGLQENKKNIEYIKKHISSSDKKLNDLFLLLSLAIKTGIELGDDYLLDNDTFYLKTSRECIELNSINSVNEKQRSQFLNNIDSIKHIVKCIKSDEIYSNTIKDINAIESIIKNLFDIESKNKEEKQNIRSLIKGMITSLYYLFLEDYELKQNTNNDATNFRLFNILFWSFMVMAVLFVNKYFIKHQEYYSAKSKKFFGKPREVKKHTSLKESISDDQKSKTRTTQEQSKTSSNSSNQINSSTYSKEDLEYIEKLKNVQGNAEFIITH